MNTRRKILLALGAVALGAPFASSAQPSARVFRIGTLSIGVAGDAGANRIWDVLWQALREAGYAEGKNLVVERRFAEGKPERLPELAVDLVAAKVDLIVVPSSLDMRAAANATRTIPIVGALAADYVLMGFAASLARPGGNVTGNTVSPVEMISKRLELLKEVQPKARRVVVLFQRFDNAPPERRALIAAQLAETERAAKALKLETQSIDVGNAAELEAAFESVRKWRADGVVLQDHPLLFNLRAEIAALGLKHLLPVIAPVRNQAEAGALVSYGVDFAALMRNAASFVDRIFKGAKPGDLPIEQPTKYELAVNLKTAKALGVAIPQSVRLRADRVIE